MHACHFRLPALAFAASAVVVATSALSNGAQAGTLKTLHTFCSEAKCADGDRPLAGLLRDSSGNLFGTTEVGGESDNGEVFELKRNGTAWDFQVIYSFCSRAGCSDGSGSAARLIMDTNGSLYGTTEFGGPFKCGTVFRLSSNAQDRKWRLQTLHDFCDRDGDGLKEVMTELPGAQAVVGDVTDKGVPAAMVMFAQILQCRDFTAQWVKVLSRGVLVNQLVARLFVQIILVLLIVTQMSPQPLQVTPALACWQRLQFFQEFSLSLQTTTQRFINRLGRAGKASLQDRARQSDAVLLPTKSLRQIFIDVGRNGFVQCILIAVEAKGYSLRVAIGE